MKTCLDGRDSPDDEQENTGKAEVSETLLQKVITSLSADKSRWANCKFADKHESCYASGHFQDSKYGYSFQLSVQRTAEINNPQIDPKDTPTIPLGKMNCLHCGKFDKEGGRCLHAVTQFEVKDPKNYYCYAIGAFYLEKGI